MIQFSLSLNHKDCHFTIVEPWDNYGENNQHYFSEDPLIYFESEFGKIEFTLSELFSFTDGLKTAEQEIILSNEDVQHLVNKIYTIHPQNYLCLFT